MINQSIKIIKPNFSVKIVTSGKQMFKKEQRILELACSNFFNTYGTIRAKDISNNDILRRDIGKEIIKKIHYITITVKTKEKIS